ncbi:MAG: acyl-CoA thioesterase [Pseudomonadota bacterium]
MYPFGRLIWQMIIAAQQPKLEAWEEHTSYHYCMPWDVDMFGEMNNGRVLTFTDLGRFPLALRGGLIGVILRKKWQLSMAGATVRWQRRILPFRRYTMKSSAIGCDEKFVYLHHTIWRNEMCHASILYRACARKGRERIPIEEFLAEIRITEEVPALPAWVENWRKCEDTRSWPPEEP